MGSQNQPLIQMLGTVQSAKSGIHIPSTDANNADRILENDANNDNNH
jgi:hypothetical protein